MEWVETTARTVPEAKDLALDQLGVDEDDAEFEILEEPRPGLFGRVRGEARVRARVRPSRPRPKLDRRERRRREAKGDVGAADEAIGAQAGSGAGSARVPADAGVEVADAGVEAADPGLEAAVESALDAVPARGVDTTAVPESGAPAVAAESGAPAAGEAPPAAEMPEEVVGDRVESNGGGGAALGPEAVAPAAVAFLEGLAGAFGLEATPEVRSDGEEVEVRLSGRDLGLLIGPRGQTLLAIQDLARTVSQRGVIGRSRLHIDIGGYRERRREALARFTTDVARQVLDSGVPRMLEPMASVDRKVVHDTATTIDGVETRSEGEEPTRRVVILPASAPR